VFIILTIFGILPITLVSLWTDLIGVGGQNGELEALLCLGYEEDIH
jgi:hypothetical protein